MKIWLEEIHVLLGRQT